MSSENSKNSKRQPRIIRASSLSSSAHRAVSENVSIDARDELRIRTKKIDFEERKKEQRAARRRYSHRHRNSELFTRVFYSMGSYFFAMV